MIYSFDEYGWLFNGQISGRTVSTEPPAHGEKTIGELYPNWTGTHWVMVPYAEPVPPEPVPVIRAPISKREFLKLFTPAEYGAIKAATAANSTVDYYWQQFILAEFISLDDPDTLGGLQLLEGAGLLAAGRAAEIVA